MKFVSLGAARSIAYEMRFDGEYDFEQEFCYWEQRCERGEAVRRGWASYGSGSGYDLLVPYKRRVRRGSRAIVVADP